MPDVVLREPKDVEALCQDIVRQFRAIPLQPYLDNELRLMERLHAEWFRRGAGPSGTPWPANKPATIKRKGHNRVLFGIPAQGFRLSKSLTMQMAEFAVRYAIDDWPNRAQLIFGTDAPYSGVHNDGYPAKNIPQREHVGLTLAFVDGMAERLGDHLVSKMVLK